MGGSQHVDEKWAEIAAAHEGAVSRGSCKLAEVGLRGPLPATDFGLLYLMRPSAGEIAAVLAPSLHDAQIAAGVPANEFRSHCLYYEGPATELRNDSPLLSQPVNPIAKGAPRLARSANELRNKAPAAAGIYRIFRDRGDGTAEVYVGKAENLRRRLTSHEKIVGPNGWGWAEVNGVYCVQMLALRAADEGLFILQDDLNVAEEAQIAAALRHLGRKKFHGHRDLKYLANKTRGANGKVGAEFVNPLYIWKAQPPVATPTQDSRPVADIPRAQSDPERTWIPLAEDSIPPQRSLRWSRDPSWLTLRYQIARAVVQLRPGDFVVISHEQGYVQFMHASRARLWGEASFLSDGGPIPELFILKSDMARTLIELGWSPPARNGKNFRNLVRYWVDRGYTPSGPVRHPWIGEAEAMNAAALACSSLFAIAGADAVNDLELTLDGHKDVTYFYEADSPVDQLT